MSVGVVCACVMSVGVYCAWWMSVGVVLCMVDECRGGIVHGG